MFYQNHFLQQAQQKSLPQTVVRLTGEIYQKAKAEKNSPQMLKAYIWQMKFREEITPDSFYVSLNGLEQWAVTTDKPLDRAILHSLIGSMYADYASQNRWKLFGANFSAGPAPLASIIYRMIEHVSMTSSP